MPDIPINRALPDIPGNVAFFGLIGLVGLVAGLLVAMYLRQKDREPAAGPAQESVVDPLALLDVIPQAHIIVNATSMVERASPQAYSLGLVRGSRIIRSEIVADVKKARENNEVVTNEFSMRRSSLDGTGSVELAVRVAPLDDSRLIVLFSDSTAAKRLEATRRDFVANISHELKTPIGAISLLAETIEDCADEPEHVATFAAQLQKESARLSSLVQDIIQLSRLQDTDVVTDRELIPISQIVGEAVDWSTMVATDRNVELVSKVTTEAQVYGDRSLLVTAVRNLLDNAVRYSDPKSRVAVGTDEVDGWLKVAVVDQGAGIPYEQQDRVFERFFRGDEARTTETGGSGLGLSIVKHVAADHGGSIHLWSEPGKGSTFTLTLPVALPLSRSSADQTEEDES